MLQLGRDAAGRPAGPFRLTGPNPLMTPRPMVSRAFGDTNCTAWGLTHVPDITQLDFATAGSAAPASPGVSSSSDSSPTAASVDATYSAGSVGSANFEVSSEGGSGSNGDAAARKHVLILGSDGFWDATNDVDAVLTALG